MDMGAQIPLCRVTPCGNATAQAQREPETRLYLDEKLYLELHLETQGNPMQMDSAVHKKLK